MKPLCMNTFSAASADRLRNCCGNWPGVPQDLQAAHQQPGERGGCFSAAAFVEQAFRQLHGYEKLEKALETASVLLEKRGIPFSTEEMKILIESAVGQFNDAFFRNEAFSAGGRTMETGEEDELAENAEAAADPIYN